MPALATASGGHVVSINDQTENDFLLQTFGGNFFIGLTDEVVEGTLASGVSSAAL